MAAPVQDAVMLLGDSLTQGGWDPYGLAQQLACVYVRKLDVINRGFSGYTTEWAIPVFEQCLVQRSEQPTAQRIRLLAIWYGANDACLPGFVQHVPVGKFAANLTHLVHMVRDPSSAWYSPETQVILITPPPLNENQWYGRREANGAAGAKDREFRLAKQYAQTVRDVAAREKIPVADAWQAVWDAADQKEEALSKYLSDGLHLTADGYSVVYGELIKTIKEHVPELHYENLREVFIRWDEIDPNDPRTSLKRRKADA